MPAFSSATRRQRSRKSFVIPISSWGFGAFSVTGSPIRGPQIAHFRAVLRTNAPQFGQIGKKPTSSSFAARTCSSTSPSNSTPHEGHFRSPARRNAPQFVHTNRDPSPESASGGGSATASPRAGGGAPF